MLRIEGQRERKKEVDVQKDVWTVIDVYCVHVLLTERQNKVIVHEAVIVNYLSTARHGARKKTECMYRHGQRFR